MEIGEPQKEVIVVPKETDAPIPQERPAPPRREEAPAEEEREKVPAE